MRPPVMKPPVTKYLTYLTKQHTLSGAPVSGFNPGSPFFRGFVPPRHQNNGPYSHPVTRGFGMALGPGIFAGFLANFFTIYSILLIADTLNRDKASRVPGKKSQVISKESTSFGPPLALVEGLLSGAFNMGIKGPYSFGNEYPDYSPKVHFCANLQQPPQRQTSQLFI
ncbi:MAG: hypothetical protein EBT63_00845 [Proteobacteria bacterium]|nr:hypothetical protein [Pseudomonadota bacterium]NCA28205.1 hypothetical protein [Pseudomonadota bacterium]